MLLPYKKSKIFFIYLVTSNSKGKGTKFTHNVKHKNGSALYGSSLYSALEHGRGPN